MKFKPQLLIEDADFDAIENTILTEGTSTPSYKIRGPFIEMNIQNKNRRMYPKPVVEPQVALYQKLIEKNRAVGELEHPQTLEINPERIAIKTTKLQFDGENIVIGEANVCSTPKGMIIRALMDDGIQMAVSSRGSGTLSEGVVQNDYKYICNDVVWEPSAPSAFVEGILESEAKTEWILKEGVLVEQQIEKLKQQKSKISKLDLKEGIIRLFESSLDMAVQNLEKDIVGCEKVFKDNSSTCYQIIDESGAADLSKGTNWNLNGLWEQYNQYGYKIFVILEGTNKYAVKVDNADKVTVFDTQDYIISLKDISSTIPEEIFHKE